MIFNFEAKFFAYKNIVFSMFLLMFSCTSKVSETLTPEAEKATLEKASQDPESSIELLENSTLGKTAPSCSPSASLKLVVTQNAKKKRMCKDQTKLSSSYKLGPICQEGVEILAVNSSDSWVPCESIQICGKNANRSIELPEQGDAKMKQLDFTSLPWGCEGKIVSRFESSLENEVDQQEISIQVFPPPCPTCDLTKKESCALCGTDSVAPRIEQIVTDTNQCNNIRLIVFAVDGESGLHREAYSFDSGKTWQAESFRDYPGLQFQIQSEGVWIRDRAGNITKSNKAYSATGEPCPCEIANGDKVPHGQTVTLFKRASVSCNEKCENETEKRTCDNGKL